MKKIFSALCVFALAGLSAAQAETPLNSEAIVTKHQGVFNGETVDYTATLSETVITDDEGQPTGTLSSTAYVATGLEDPAARPVMFIWNGGPSSASITLHMAGLGPKRLVIPADPKAPIEAPYTYQNSPDALLDVADLVFVDPVETGFSRLLKEDERSAYYSTTGDAKAATRYITDWLEDHGRTASPVYVLGTSYGSIRAPLVAGMLAETSTPASGLVIFSQAANLLEVVQRKHNIVGYAVNMPQIAAIAHYHGRTAYQKLSVYELLDKSYDYFMGDYLGVLAAGHSLTEKERKQTAETLAKFTGISAQYYLDHDLLITKEEFLNEFFKEEGLVMARNDTRYVGKKGEIASNPPVQGADDALRQYMSDELGAGAISDQYRDSAPDTGGWDYVGQIAMGGRDMPMGAPRSVFVDYDWIKSITAAFEANPEFHFFVGTGVYDTLTTAGSARLLVNDVHLPKEGVELHEYEGGHSFYSNDAEIGRLSDDLRAFITQ